MWTRSNRHMGRPSSLWRAAAAAEPMALRCTNEPPGGCCWAREAHALLTALADPGVPARPIRAQSPPAPPPPPPHARAHTCRRLPGRGMAPPSGILCRGEVQDIFEISVSLCMTKPPPSCPGGLPWTTLIADVSEAPHALCSLPTAHCFALTLTQALPPPDSPNPRPLAWPPCQRSFKLPRPGRAYRKMGNEGRRVAVQPGPHSIMYWSAPKIETFCTPVPP